MASTAHGAGARIPLHVTGRNGLVDKYFYVAMSLLFATIVVAGFSQTINTNLFHAAPPRPFLPWIHGVAFLRMGRLLHLSGSVGSHAPVTAGRSNQSYGLSVWIVGCLSPIY
jgi:hypothetical protein